MSLPNRKSRPLTVDGVDYRWSCSDSFCGESDTHKLFVSVQSAAGDGAKILATGRCKTRPYLLTPQLTVTPIMVAKMIREAVQNGWSPDAKQDYQIVELEKFKIQDQ